MMGVIGLALLLPVPNTHATGINDNVAKGADIIMKDLRWPRWDKGTYYCQWYSGFFPDKYCTFYGGVATHGPDRRPGIFTSYWAVTKTVHEGEYFFGKGYGAEGTRGGAGGAPPFLRPGSWYRFVMRVFPPDQGAGNETYVGYWIKDVDKNRWHVHSILSIATHATGFSANSGFVEALASPARRVFDRRLGYYRLDGKWRKSHLTCRSPEKVRLIEQGTAVRFDSNLDTGKKDTPTVTKQPDAPGLDALKIEKTGASAWKNQVVVNWGLAPASTPQIGYKIEVFANSEAKGAPVKVFEDSAPHVFVKRLDVGRAARGVRLTVKDIFDQTRSVAIPVREVTPAPARAGGKHRRGLRYAYYEAPNGSTWERLPPFSDLKPVRQGAVNSLDVSVRQGAKGPRAMRYTGYLRAPAAGLYVFSLRTCDGSRLVIDGKTVGDNDGIHSRCEKQYAATLGKGLHAFDLSYFRQGGHAVIDPLAVFWEGPGLGRRRLGDGDFTYEVTAHMPSITLAQASRGKDQDPQDNLVTIDPKIDAQGRTIERVDYFCGKLLLGSVSKKPYLLRQVFPQGENRVLARLWFDKSNSVDSNLLTHVSRNLAGPWQVEPLGEKGLTLGIRCKGKDVSFIGEGSCFVYQGVDGDFTLTARIAEISLTKDTGTNKLNWMGLNMTEPDVRLVRTAGVGMRGRKNYPDLAGTRMAIPRFTEGQWLRLVRRGRRNQSFTSVDGKTWSKTEEVVGAARKGKDRRVGFVFQVVPRAGQGVFHGVLDNVTLVKGRVPDEVRPRPRKEDLRGDKRITALVQAQDNPEILYARSTNAGLLKSKNRGRTWRQMNAELTTADALAVRSVAVHPTDSSVVLRGGGSIMDGKLVSGLWKSTDGGGSWKRVGREIDFDGRGPTTIFGEVIAFNAQRPNVVAVGGETGGLFMSVDAGETWKYVALKAERITCVSFIGGQLHVGTFADSEFEALDLGKPAASVARQPGRVYHFGKPGRKPTVRFEMADTGVTSLGESYFTTTRGVYYGGRWGVRQPLYQLPGDVLYAAIGDGAGGTYAAPFSTEPNRIYRANARWLWTVLGDDAEQARIKTALTAGAPMEVPTMWNGYASRPVGKDKFLAPGLNAGGISCIRPDRKDANTLYVCNCDGILKSSDGGKSYKTVYRALPHTKP